MKRDLFDTDTPSEALIDTGRRAGDREPHMQSRESSPAGAAAGSGCDTPPESASALARARICGDCAESSKWVTPSGHDTGMLDCAQLQPWHHMNPKATCHFSPSRWRSIDPAVLAKRVKQQGIDQAVGAADRAAPGWSDRAVEFLRKTAAANEGMRLTGYELVQRSIGMSFEQPENPKAWGGPLQRASRAGYLVKVGTVPDPNPDRHGSDVPLWECACVQ